MRQLALACMVLALGALIGHAADTTTRPAGARLPTQTMPAFTRPATHQIDVILARPTDTAITASVLAYRDVRVRLLYGTSPTALTNTTADTPLTASTPHNFLLTSLKPNTHYHYALHDADGRPLATGSFHTARPAGTSFTFTITADSHLDEHSSFDTYRKTLANITAAKPDFHIDLGDTFMNEKHPTRAAAHDQYLAQRYFLGSIAQSAPFFFVLGNHDGEYPRGQAETENSLAVWSNLTRKKFFPNPVPDNFFTGNTTRHPVAGDLQNYYAFGWGDAHILVLDPFWYSPRQRRTESNWSRTLGPTQYAWLKKTLESSDAKYTFVFIHHLVGGLDLQARGGAEAASLYEWGGKNADGTDGFKTHRPNLPMPIHDLLKKHGVQVVFHGHDHLYAKQEHDGIIYQEVPQPSDPRGTTRSAADYGYKSGTLAGSSGHMRVDVTPAQATITYVRSAGREAANEPLTYTVKPR